MESGEIEKTEPCLVYQDYNDIDELEYPELYLGEEYLGGESEQKSNENNSNEASGESSQGRKLRLPVSKIKNMMKLDPDAGKISLEALVLATKATEMFVDALAKEAFTQTVAAKKKTLRKTDVEVAITQIDALFFLEGCFKT
ncbi:DNA polymerase epsilon subunit 4 [Phlebotomus papatasi]|uniref:Transcription factor CBF/NF-Y/archaeal histone domain-containing protein n=1 Tax=Phlebotomus papatasi TaxID=29031 RepID=A0A1B0DBQ8_PHLPP|nr:DNA polymerase epsilon subunit 4 [Phlebotomus papatasi]